MNRTQILRHIEHDVERLCEAIDKIDEPVIPGRPDIVVEEIPLLLAYGLHRTITDCRPWFIVSGYDYTPLDSLADWLADNCEGIRDGDSALKKSIRYQFRLARRGVRRQEQTMDAEVIAEAYGQCPSGTTYSDFLLYGSFDLTEEQIKNQIRKHRQNSKRKEQKK